MYGRETDRGLRIAPRHVDASRDCFILFYLNDEQREDGVALPNFFFCSLFPVHQKTTSGIGHRSCKVVFSGWQPTILYAECEKRHQLQSAQSTEQQVNTGVSYLLDYVEDIYDEWWSSLPLFRSLTQTLSPLGVLYLNVPLISYKIITSLVL